jgi:ABC-type polysaccharide/polyol phosphate export permease
MAQTVRINRARRPSLWATMRELAGYRELILEFARRAVLLRYKNSALGIVWSLATPLMMILVITVMTKYILNQRIPNYSAFIFPVMFAWAFFAATLGDMCASLLEHVSLVRKCYFPRELLPLATMLANLFHLVVAMGLALGYLVLLRIFPHQVNWEVLLLVLIIPAQALVVLGLGMVVAALNTLFEDIRFVVQVLLQLLFYCVPVLYPIERVAAAASHDFGVGWFDQLVRPHLLSLYLLNPFASVLVLYQKALLPPIQNAGAPALPFSWALLGQLWVEALLIAWGGLWVFNALKWKAVERV